MTRSRNLTIGLVLSAILAVVDIVGLAGLAPMTRRPPG